MGSLKHHPSGRVTHWTDAWWTWKPHTGALIMWSKDKKKRTKCYFLIYRGPDKTPINWVEPTGGLVVEPKKIVDDIPIADIGLVQQVAEHRYHYGPGEFLVIAEVFEPLEQGVADALHDEYEKDLREFLELMEV
jgi:hypothetical protein